MSCFGKALAICGVLLGPISAAASPTMVETFATCAGRLSAELEHAWLMYDPASEVLEHQLTQFRDIVAALADDQIGAELLALRIDAKFAQASLLQTASFGTDARRRALARTYALGALSQCRDLLLDS